MPFKFAGLVAVFFSLPCSVIFLPRALSHLRAFLIPPLRIDFDGLFLRFILCNTRHLARQSSPAFPHRVVTSMFIMYPRTGLTFLSNPFSLNSIFFLATAFDPSRATGVPPIPPIYSFLSGWILLHSYSFVFFFCCIPSDPFRFATFTPFFASVCHREARSCKSPPLRGCRFFLEFTL